MVPFIPFMTAQQKAPYLRATSVQKCVRTADIDEVGKTTRHGTFFQMNGNFSFGDYFKKEAIEYAWEFVTGKKELGCLGFEIDKIWVTVWEGDDEAYQYWLNVGLPQEHLQKRDKKENFWSTGGSGPAGPCSEIFYDRGELYGDGGGPIHDDLVGTERYLEIWNLVFMQWQIDTVKSKYEFNVVGDLKQKNIDTGMGLERVAFLMQNKENIYEIDEVFPVIQEVERLTGKKYLDNQKDDVYMRILADHIRSSLMLISDGVTPNNEGRGYVLRRLMRRCVRSIKLLGYNGEAFDKLFFVSKEAMKESYPELESNWDKIINIAINEERIFAKTLENGNKYLDDVIKDVRSSSDKISGSNAFKLHDTHGFPLELTLEIAQEAGVGVDVDEFKKLMQEQKDRARTDAINKRGSAVDLSVYSAFAKEVAQKLNKVDFNVVGNNAGLSEFLGYNTLSETVRIIGIITNDGPAKSVKANQNGKDSDYVDVELILDRTPFYAESGGQKSDEGYIYTESGAEIRIDDVQKPIPELSVHKAKLISGEIILDDKASAHVDIRRRDEIAKAHTSTHIIHKALHEIIGDGATQSGSENSPSKVRFDFKSLEALSQSQLVEIEELANDRVRENSDVFAQYMDIKKAQKIGAMALFGEKYGDHVRVVSLGSGISKDDSWSTELCGGTHVAKTGSIGTIKIVDESSIGSGLRRIEALVGGVASSFNAKEHLLVNSISTLLGTKDYAEIEGRLISIMKKLKDQEKELAKILKDKILTKTQKLVDNVQKCHEINLICDNIGEIPSVDVLRTLVLDIKSRVGESDPYVIAVIGINNDRPAIVVATNQNARDLKISAGELVKLACAELGGGGGGKPDLAQGGGNDISKINQALEALKRCL